MAALGWSLAATRALGQQVPNDDLANRLPLTVGRLVESRTDGCTVQWGCVDEKLTGKCIDYHNDQWFSFRAPRRQRYYVNIARQQCRDVRGVQLVVLTAGVLCQPSTYRILSCTSLGTQDDVFVVLDPPPTGEEVLLCIDGYLHDYCRFALTVDSVAYGLPAASLPPLPAPAPVASAAVPLTWTLPDSLAAQAEAFVVRRRPWAAARGEEAALVPVARTAVGGTVRTYSLTDTLPAPGRYVYQVLAEGPHEPTLVYQQAVVWNGQKSTAAPPYVQLPLDDFPVGAELSVFVADATTGRLLRRAQVVKQKNAPNQGRLLVETWRRAGVVALRVTISHSPGSGRPARTQEVEITL